MDATLWALIALLLFFAILVWQNVPTKIAFTLDERAQKIKSELEEARRMREEAQGVLADYKRRLSEAEREAADILQNAEREAEHLLEQSNLAVDAYVSRKSAAADMRIARAQAQALSEIRAKAAQLAVGGAQNILSDLVEGETAIKLTSKSIKETVEKVS